MILIYPDFDLELDFSKHQNYLLVIENSKQFYSCCKMLFEQVKGLDGNFVLSEKFNRVHRGKT